jgi:hypothetical protein
LMLKDTMLPISKYSLFSGFVSFTLNSIFKFH